MNFIFIGFILALGFGLASTYFFLKASSIYFSYKEAVKRVTKGKVELPNWRFIFPLTELKEYETTGLMNKRLDHQKYITRYWSLVILMIAMIVIVLISGNNPK